MSAAIVHRTPSHTEFHYKDSHRDNSSCILIPIKYMLSAKQQYKIRSDWLVRHSNVSSHCSSHSQPYWISVPKTLIETIRVTYWFPPSIWCLSDSRIVFVVTEESIKQAFVIVLSAILNLNIMTLVETIQVANRFPPIKSWLSNSSKRLVVTD